MAKIEYENKEEVFNFEKKFCVEFTKTWVNKAWNLRNSSEAIYEIDACQTQVLFDKTKEPILKEIPLCNSSNIQRMLWAYSFENLFKVLIILKLKNEENITEVPINDLKDHDLQQLAKKTNFILSNDESFYLGILTKTSIWAGRYPIPFKQHYLAKSRAPMSSREELTERSKQQFNRFLKGKINRVIDENDVLNTGIGTDEIKLYRILFEKLIKKYEQFEINI